MITFITALYPEAKDLIRALQLKQNPTETLYQLFEGDDIRLIITGAGMLAAATATARHFALYPSKTEHDLVINLGVAGYAPDQSLSCSRTIGDLFLVSKLTEQATGRTFYPDLLYRHSFAMLPLITSPVIVQTPSGYNEEVLIDMEASALYQALLPHISPDRMLFFKVISDLPGHTPLQTVQPETLLKPHIDAIISFAQQLHTFLSDTAPRGVFYTAEETTLVEQIKSKLPMTETMLREFERLLLYAKLSHLPICQLLYDFLALLENCTIRGKKQAMPYFNQFRDMIVTELPKEQQDNSSCQPDYTQKEQSTQSLYLPFFSTIYVEKGLQNEYGMSDLSGSPILIDHYKDIFNRSHQDFSAQKHAPSIILANKTGTLIYKGAPVCQSFGNEHFYYTSCMMNCIYHCDYCYLQGMYPSGHVVVFVNLKDYFIELEALLLEHPVYLCISYDTDLLALEKTFSFVSRWLSFAAEHPDLTLEIRTKSGNPAVFEQLAELYSGKTSLKKQIIFAWTVSPEQLCQTTEHGAASLSLRLKALLAAKEAGFSVRLCFDPMIFHANWKRNYSTLVEYIFSKVSADLLYDVSVGVFRISTDYLKNMRKKRPDSAIVQYPYITENGVSHYGTLSEEMVDYLQKLLLKYVPAEKIFIWNGGL